MSLKIIGTGLGRTGTHSLKLALEKLGFGRCYHMVELFQNPEGLKYFESAERLEHVNWNELFSDYHSAVDYPIARYYKQIADFYPDAKVIHNIRDSESWFRSASGTIFDAGQFSFSKISKFGLRYVISSEVRKRFPVLKYNGRLLTHEFGKDLKNKELVIQRFNDHTEEVVRTISKERLLVFDPREGWAPLCSFLGVEIPSAPFPKTNSRDDFYRMVDIIGKGEMIY